MTQEHQRPDDGLISITRGIPLPWLLSTVGTLVSAILVWAASQYFGQKFLAEKVDAMALKVEATTAVVTANSNKTMELTIYVTDLRRRIELLEQRRP